MDRTEAIEVIVAKQRKEVAMFAQMTDAQMASAMSGVSTETLTTIAGGDESPMGQVALQVAKQYGLVDEPCNNETCGDVNDGCVAWNDDIVAYVHRNVEGSEFLDTQVINDAIEDCASDFRRDVRDTVAQMV